MSPDTIATIISVSIVVLAIAIIVTVIVSKIRHLSRTLFGTSSLIEGIQGVKEDQEQMRETPRSLHGMTSVYMPMIKKDFPELDVEQYMNKTRSLLRNYFSAVESKRLGVIAEEVTPNFTTMFRELSTSFHLLRIHSIMRMSIFTMFRLPAI